MNEKNTPQISNEELKKVEETSGAKSDSLSNVRIKNLKIQIFDIMEKQGVHQSEIKKLEQEKIKIYEELNKLRDNNSG